MLIYIAKSHTPISGPTEKLEGLSDDKKCDYVFLRIILKGIKL